MDKDSEKLIGARLRAFRETLQIPRSRFAVTIGYGSERIASYESGRAPLPYIVFVSAFEKYNLSPQWLALGVGSPKWGEADDSLILKAKYSTRDSFSSVYKNQLAQPITTITEDTKVRIQSLTEHLNKFKDFADINPDTIPGDTIAKLKQLDQLIDKLRAWGLDDKNFRQKVQTRIFKNQSLTTYPNASTSDDVKPILPKLIERLRKATEARGRKAELADWLGVSPQKITDWLSDRMKPSGEYTLQLLHWVEQQERQK